MAALNVRCNSQPIRGLLASLAVIDSAAAEPGRYRAGSGLKEFREHAKDCLERSRRDGAQTLAQLLVIDRA